MGSIDEDESTWKFDILELTNKTRKLGNQGT